MVTFYVYTIVVASAVVGLFVVFLSTVVSYVTISTVDCTFAAVILFVDGSLVIVVIVVDDISLCGVVGNLIVVVNICVCILVVSTKVVSGNFGILNVVNLIEDIFSKAEVVVEKRSCEDFDVFGEYLIDEVDLLLNL